MIRIENVAVSGFEAAIRGMRNPMNSWNLSDSNYCANKDCESCRFVDSEYNGLDGTTVICHNHMDCTEYIIGQSDLELMSKLSKAGSDHAKYLRMIAVSCDITAPLYWWKEADTYKVGTVSNSCSTMHKIHAKKFTLDDFSHEKLIPLAEENLEETIRLLNVLRDVYLNGSETRQNGDKTIWYNLIQMLPSSYNQRRTWHANYAVLKNIYHARRNHKLDEWREFCDWIESLPYAKELIICD